MLQYGAHTFYDQTATFSTAPNEQYYTIQAPESKQHVTFGQPQMVTMVVRE